MEQLIVNPQSGQFDFPLTIKNYWAKSQKFKVKVDSLSPYVTISSREFELDSLVKGATHRLHITGSVSPKSPHMAKLKVTLTHRGHVREYPFEFILAQELGGQKNLKEVTIQLDDEMRKALSRSFFSTSPFTF